MEDITSKNKRISGDGCVRISFYVDRAAMISGVLLDGNRLPEGHTVLEVPAGFPNARIHQHFMLQVSPGGGNVCKVTKTFIN